MVGVDKHRCFYCQRKFVKDNAGTHKDCAETIDHIVPKSIGGNNLAINRVPSCRQCNAIKNNLTLEDFLNVINSMNGSDYLETVKANIKNLMTYVSKNGKKLYKPNEGNSNT